MNKNTWLGFVHNEKVFVYRTSSDSRWSIPVINESFRKNYALKPSGESEDPNTNFYEGLEYKINKKPVKSNFIKIDSPGKTLPLNLYLDSYEPLTNLDKEDISSTLKTLNSQSTLDVSGVKKFIDMNEHDEYSLDSPARVFCQKVYRDKTDKKMNRPVGENNYFRANSL